jgi:hypothetical protein
VAEYYTLRAIAERMGIDRSTLLRWVVRRRFLMYRRTRRGKPVWYTNDRLIQTWETAQCAKDATEYSNRPTAARHARVNPRPNRLPS